MAKLPAFQFYPGDWLQDKVAGCSLAAQGLWLRMLFIAHNSDLRGYLGSKLVPMAPEAIARQCGASLGEYMELLSELEIHGVPSRTPTGTLFSRRMIRDEKSRQSNKFRQQDYRNHHKTNGNSNGDVTPMSQQSSSSISSSTTELKTNTTAPLKRRGYRIPETFSVTEAHRQFAVEHKLEPPDSLIAEFLDYWLAVPGVRGTKLDWDATFRNRMRQRPMKKNGNFFAKEAHFESKRERLLRESDED